MKSSREGHRQNLGETAQNNCSQKELKNNKKSNIGSPKVR